MDWIQLIWAIPGYFALVLYYDFKEIPHKGTWDFFVKLAPFSLLTFISGRIIHTLLLMAFPGLATIDQDLNSYFEFDHSLIFACTVTLGTSLAVFVAPPIVELVKWLFGIKTEKPLLIRSLESLRPGPDSDSEKLVIVHLKNRKVYVGNLVDFSKPNEEKFLIKITPIISGFRSAENLQVEFNTNYAFDGTKSFPDRDVLISFDEISSIARFDTDLHKAFVANGRTKVSFDTAELPLTPPV